MSHFPLSKVYICSALQRGQSLFESPLNLCPFLYFQRVCVCGNQGHVWSVIKLISKPWLKRHRTFCQNISYNPVTQLSEYSSFSHFIPPCTPTFLPLLTLHPLPPHRFLVSHQTSQTPAMFIGSSLLFLLPFFPDGRFWILQGRK